MAATKSYDGSYRETWTEAVWMDGGATATITTAIPLSEKAAVRAQQLLDTDVRVNVDDLVGTPDIGITSVTALQTKATTPEQWVVQVVLTNNAVAGNQAKYSCEIEYIHSSIK